MKKKIVKTKKEQSQSVLSFLVEDGVMTVSIFNGEKTKKVVVEEKDALLPAVASACLHLSKKQAHPDVIVVRGNAERFSESRSIVTIANALAYAWNIPVFVDETGKKDLWPLTPMYSSEPHITKSKKQISLEKKVS